MSAIVAFGTITGSVATVALVGTGDLVHIESTLNQNVELTFDGANGSSRTLAILGVSGIRNPLPIRVRDGATVGIRHYGTAPTSGNIAISVLASGQ